MLRVTVGGSAGLLRGDSPRGPLHAGAQDHFPVGLPSLCPALFPPATERHYHHPHAQQAQGGESHSLGPSARISASKRVLITDGATWRSGAVQHGGPIRERQPSMSRAVPLGTHLQFGSRNRQAQVSVVRAVLCPCAVRVAHSQRGHRPVICKRRHRRAGCLAWDSRGSA
jgi:hypothetical protein